MTYFATSAVAHLCRVNRRQLYRWRALRLIYFPPLVRMMAGSGKWTKFYLWTKLDIAPVLEVAKACKNRKRAARRRMDPAIKKQRAELRRQIRATEILLNLANWFERNPHCSRNHLAWENAYRHLNQAVLLDSENKLTEGAIAGLESKLTELRTAYIALPGRHDGIRIPKRVA